MSAGSRTSTNILLLILLLIIIVIIALQWFNPPRLQFDVTASGPAQTPLKPFSSAAQTPLNVAIAPLQEYQEIVERPLFFATRRPAPPQVQEQATPAEPVPDTDVPMTLIGIVKTPDAKIALVKNDETGKVARLKLGETIEDWALEIIENERVVLRKGEKTKEVQLLRNQRKPTQRTTRQVEALRKRQQLIQQQRQAQAQTRAEGSEQAPLDDPKAEQSLEETTDDGNEQAELESNSVQTKTQRVVGEDDDGHREEPTNGIPTKGVISRGSDD